MLFAYAEDIFGHEESAEDEECVDTQVSPREVVRGKVKCEDPEQSDGANLLYEQSGRRARG